MHFLFFLASCIVRVFAAFLFLFLLVFVFPQMFDNPWLPFHFEEEDVKNLLEACIQGWGLSTGMPRVTSHPSLRGVPGHMTFGTKTMTTDRQNGVVGYLR